LLKPFPEGHTPESAGPLTWGFRLESTNTQDAWRIITYAKGPWILHMLRQRMGDERFLKMLAEVRRRYQYSTIGTRQFQALAKEFQAPRTPADSMDVFFDNWVYSTGVPALKLKSATRVVPSATAAPTVRLTGTVEQSDVDADFSVDVPVEIQFAKGAPQILWVRTANEPVPFSATVREAPVRVVIPAGSSVLAIRK
jgi:aminopeptidase N